MPSANRSIKQLLRDYLASNQPAAITEAVWQHLLQDLAPVSESYLRDLLRATGLPFDQPYAGIRQHTFEELEQSLLDVLQVYREALSTGQRDRARYCRRQVIAAKDRAKFLAITPRTTPEKRTEKEEMAQWMLVWLENPEVFPAWVDARRGLTRLPVPGQLGRLTLPSNNPTPEPLVRPRTVPLTPLFPPFPLPNRHSMESYFFQSFKAAN